MCRLARNSSELFHMTQTMSSGSLNIAAMSAAIPFPLHRHQRLSHVLYEAGKPHVAPFFRPFVPLARSEARPPIAIASVLRGIPNDSVHVTAATQATQTVPSELERCQSVSELWNMYISASQTSHAMRYG